MTKEIKMIECPAANAIPAFAISETPITQEQYEAVMGRNPSHFRGPTRPVECVSWYDAKEFCAKLTEQHRAAGILKPDEAYDLPSEAEWMHAATCGGTEPLVYGKPLDIGWFWENSDAQTHPVGEKQPNKWGLFDMLGNVWEWTRTECKD